MAIILPGLWARWLRHLCAALLGCFCPPSVASVRAFGPFRDHAGERAAPRRRHRRPGITQPGVVIPQPVPAQREPDSDADHAGFGGLSDGPGESYPGGELHGSGAHHVLQSPAFMPVLGRIFGEYKNESRTRKLGLRTRDDPLCLLRKKNTKKLT